MSVTMAETPQHPGKGGRRHRFADLYHERTNYQFIDRSWRWLMLSGSLGPDLAVGARCSAASTSASTSRAARSGSSP